jgi:hypothetical protein
LKGDGAKINTKMVRYLSVVKFLSEIIQIGYKMNEFDRVIVEAANLSNMLTTKKTATNTNTVFFQNICTVEGGYFEMRAIYRVVYIS